MYRVDAKDPCRSMKARCCDRLRQPTGPWWRILKRTVSALLESWFSVRKEPVVLILDGVSGITKELLEGRRIMKKDNIRNVKHLPSLQTYQKEAGEIIVAAG